MRPGSLNRLTLGATHLTVGNVLFNNALNTFYLRLYGVGHMVKDHSDSESEETRCHHIGYSFRLAARVLLYVSSHRQNNTHHGLCYTSRGALAGTRNSSMGPPHEGSIRPPIALTTELHLAPVDRSLHSVLQKTNQQLRGVTGFSR